jgi:hypothetical protein
MTTGQKSKYKRNGLLPLNQRKGTGALKRRVKKIARRKDRRKRLPDG